MYKEKWTAALIQMDSRENESRNLEAAARKVREAALQGADLVMLPETVDFIGRDMRSHGKTVPGPVSELFRELARENHIYLHCGSITEGAGGEKCRNTSLLFDPGGEIAGRYSKLHLFDAQSEKSLGYPEEIRRLNAALDFSMPDAQNKNQKTGGKRLKMKSRGYPFP